VKKNMEHKKVLKFLEIIGFIFMIVSALEVVFFITLNFTPFDNIISSPVFLSEFIYGSSYTGKNSKIQSASLAKLMVLTGMIILMGGMLKLNYLVLLGRTRITTLLGPVSFQSAMYRFDISPLSAGIFWLYFIAANCSYLIAALVITAVGIKWTILMGQEKPKES
jgi:hypothetical protein